MAQIDDPLVTVTRSGVTVLVVRAASVSVRSAIGEAPENDLTIIGPAGLLIEKDDRITIGIEGASYGAYSISTISCVLANGVATTEIALAGCGSVLRDIPTVDDDLAVASDNLAAFKAIAGYVKQESGAYFPVSFSNAELVLMDSAFAVRASNALDMIRSLAGATGNSFRITTSCGIEIGRFGADSGLFFTNSVMQSRGGHIACTMDTYHFDTSDVFGWVFVEGGSFVKKAGPPYDPDDKGESVNLSLGSRYLNTFSIVAPDGYTITEIESGKRLHYKLKTIGTTVNRGKRIQIAAITPKKLDNIDSEVAAANLLAKSAALYLAAKSDPETRISITVDKPVRASVGDKARVYLTSKSGDIIDGSFYITELNISVEGGRATTDISLSSRLVDPEELLKAGATVKLGATGRKPNQASGVQGTTMIVTPGALSAGCGGVGKETYITYWFAGFTSIPTIEIEADPGITVTVLSSSLTDATLCFYKDTVWTGAESISVILIGPRTV